MSHSDLIGLCVRHRVYGQRGDVMESHLVHDQAGKASVLLLVALVDGPDAGQLVLWGHGACVVEEDDE